MNPDSANEKNNRYDDGKIISFTSHAEKRKPADPPPAPPREPLINLPPVTKALLAVFLGIHLWLTFMMDDVGRYAVYENFGFIAGAYNGHAPAHWWTLWLGPFSYMALHGGWTHLVMNGTMMMAFGTGCERWMGGKRLLALFLLCGVAAALVQYMVNPVSTNPVIGASGGLSGLFAAVLIMIQRSGTVPLGRFGIWPFILVWIGISVVFGMMAPPGGGAIAWPAHIGGFLSGFLFLGPVMRYVRR